MNGARQGAGKRMWLELNRLSDEEARGSGYVERAAWGSVEGRDTRVDRVVAIKRLNAEHPTGSGARLAPLRRGINRVSASSTTSGRTIW